MQSLRKTLEPCPCGRPDCGLIDAEVASLGDLIRERTEAPNPEAAASLSLATKARMESISARLWDPTPEHLETLVQLVRCADAWDPRACLLGNITAGAMVAALTALLAGRVPETLEPQATWPPPGWDPALVAKLEAGCQAKLQGLGWHADPAQCNCHQRHWEFDPAAHGAWDFLGHHPACPLRPASLAKEWGAWPIMDGWNLHFAAHYVAELCDMRYDCPHVPSQPDFLVPLDPDPHFVAMGTQLQPAFSFAVRTTPAQVLDRLCRPINYGWHPERHGTEWLLRLTPLPAASSAP
jgi:hypothetical protein